MLFLRGLTYRVLDVLRVLTCRIHDVVSEGTDM